MGAARKVGYTEGAIGAMPVGNAYTFSGTTFGWLYSWSVSLPTWLRRLLSVLLITGRYECLWLDLAPLLFAEEGFGELLEDNLSSTEASASSGIMGFFPLSHTI